MNRKFFIVTNLIKLAEVIFMGDAHEKGIIR